MKFDSAFFPNRVITGKGSVKSISNLIDDYGSKRVVLFADPIIVELDLTKDMENIFQEKNVDYQVYTDIVPEPSTEVGDNSVEAVREFNADLVVGIGGGSCLDCAKVAATLATNEGSVLDYLNLNGTKKITDDGVKKVLIPTTAGTGAEVTFNAVFSLGKTKDIISDDKLLASAAIIDPELTYSLPPKVTAGSGIDALCHAIESYTSKGATQLTDVLAIDAVKKIYKNIRTAVWNGDNKEARNEMAMGSLIASLSYFNSGVHAVHAFSYPLGGRYKIPHGESNAVLMPYIFDSIWPACVEKMRDLAVAMELPTTGKNDREIALEVVQTLKYLVEDVGLPVSIEEYGVKEANIDDLVSEAMEQTRLLGKSPRKIDEDTVMNIYKAAFLGKISK